jgi:redox-sensitive bicupin YhaK (pirin superfamily)
VEILMTLGSVAHVIEPRPRDLGGFSVRRVLPSPGRKLVGPFIFFDHMGPTEFAAGAGLDVRPHPHIGLATVTYLFEGEILHRDSLGSVQPIRPGAVNWMTAGRGIAHSERSSPESRAQRQRLHGIQSWVALPRADEEREPCFRHHPAQTIPQFESQGATLRLVAGRAFGEASPVETFSDLFYLEARMPRGSLLTLPGGLGERAAYVAEGVLEVGGARAPAGRMVVLAGDEAVALEAVEATRAMLLGGAPLDGDRTLWWNFVSSSPDRIERAKADWRAGRFGAVPGETEFIPLPER